MSGGEPTLEPGLPGFLTRVKALGFQARLDTNGTRPDVLRQLLECGLLDYVAMDVKAPPDKYRTVTRSQVDPCTVEESMRLLQHWEKPPPCPHSHLERLARCIAQLVARVEVRNPARPSVGARLYPG